MLSVQSDFQQTSLAEAIRIVRHRVVANRWLWLWLVCCNWTLAALLIALAMVRSMRTPLIAGIAAVAAAAVATAIGAWYRRPSAYGLAQRLDQKSGLGDRISTAVHFWTTSDPNTMILRQRGDALAHLAKTQPREMFPLQLPPKMWRTWALLGALAVLCAYNAAYGPPIPQLKEKATKSHALATLVSPLTRALELARAEKKELADLVANSDREHNATDESKKPLDLPAAGQLPSDAAQSKTNAASLDMTQAMQMPGSDGAQQALSAQQAMQPGQLSNSNAATKGQSSAAASDKSGTQSGTQGQQSMAQRAMQALENLMASALSGEQDSQSSQQNNSPTSIAGATGTQAMSGSSQAANSPNQSAQGQTSNSQGSQNQVMPSPGKHTGAGNGTSPWQPREGRDAQLAGNTAKEHVELQTTGFRGPPGKERSDVAPGEAQIPLQIVAPQTVTTVNGAGQDSVPPRYRQYVQDYFQHSGK